MAANTCLVCGGLLEQTGADSKNIYYKCPYCGNTVSKQNTETPNKKGSKVGVIVAVSIGGVAVIAGAVFVFIIIKKKA